MKIVKLAPRKGALIYCDECGKGFYPQAIREIKILRVPYYLYMCPGCANALARKLGGKNAG